MLIIPIVGKLSKRNPPSVTIMLILINCFVFFAFQGSEHEQYAKAMAYYDESGLLKMEVVSYIRYAEAGKSLEEMSRKGNESQDILIARYCEKMWSDDAFLLKLKKGKIITPQDANYAEWKDLRTNFDSLMNEVFSQKYGFNPSDPQITSSLISMFLHGSFMHLLGNMVFLWLVGCILELSCGRFFYTLLYLLTGLCADALFAYVYPDNTGPCIGASGAIAGLMGALTVLFGLRKIKVFYSLGFYFNYGQIYAVTLLPLWIGNEVLQLWFGPPSNVAYMAHIGGLSGGAMIGFIKWKILGGVDTALLDEDPKTRIPSLMEKALQKTAELDMPGARQLLEDILKIDPQHKIALTHLFNIDKINPDPERFTKSTSGLLTLLIREGYPVEESLKIYQEYARAIPAPRFTPDLLLQLCLFFSHAGHPEEASAIIDYCLPKYPNHPRLTTALLHIAKTTIQKGLHEKGRHYLRLICDRYPQAKEYPVALNLLNKPDEA